MLTKHSSRIHPVLATSNRPLRTLNRFVLSTLTEHHCHHRQQEHLCMQCDNFLLSENASKAVPIVSFVQLKLLCLASYLSNQYEVSGKTLRKFFDQPNVSSFYPLVFQPSCGRSFSFSDPCLSVAEELVSAFSNSNTPSRIMEELVVASNVPLETLKIDSSMTGDGSDSIVSEDLCFSSGNHSEAVEFSGVENAAGALDAGLHQDVKNTGSGLELIDRETEAANKVIEFSGRETDGVEFVATVTEVTDKVSDAGGMETKKSDSVLECDGRIMDNSQRANLSGAEALVTSNASGTGDLKSNDSDREKVSSTTFANRYAEKLIQFKAKLASNQTVLPSELLLKVSQLAARCHLEGNAERLTAEYLDQPVLDLVEGIQQPDWRCEMESILMSYFDEADGVLSPSKPRKGRKKLGKGMAASEEDRPRRVEPSHFIAIQITNPEIHEKLADIQKSVVARKRILKDALVNLPTLHITLMVLYLKDNEQIERAKIALEASKTRVLEHGKGLAALPFAGIGDFNGKIVFAKVQEGPELDRLKDIAETVRQSFAEQELFSFDSKGFNAHLTIMKLSKCPWLFKKGIRKIDPDFYVEQKDDYFGSQPIQSLQLCAMKKAEGGYYPVDHEVFFESEIQDI